MNMQHKTPHIIIVGGGAGGLELAAKLGRKLGKHNKADITLVDASITHVWKPLLHEVAAGTLNSFEDEINYITFAHKNFFRFSLGTLQGLNRQKKEIILATVSDVNENISQRVLSYDILVLAIGSVANDFNIPGVKEHCLFLDNHEQANSLRNHLIQQLLHLSLDISSAQKQFNICVVGGGATGIELIAELHNAIQLMTAYGIKINPAAISFSLIEAGNKLLPALPERLSKLILEELKRLKVQIFLNERVSQVTNEGFFTQQGKFIAGDLKIWSAGIKAPDLLRDLDGLEVNRINQLIVKQTLQTTLDETIFAFGDCANCPQEKDRFVPPRAQAAHQEANFLLKALQKYLRGKPLPLFNFRDYGSLVSLSHYETVGNLMGKLTNLMLEGKVARFAYLSLYKNHQAALFGLWRTAVLTLANLLSRRIRPRLKLH